MIWTHWFSQWPSCTKLNSPNRGAVMRKRIPMYVIITYVVMGHIARPPWLWPPIRYTAFPIYRGNFSPNNSRKAPIARQLGRGMGVLREFEMWPKLFHRSCCTVCNIVLYCTAIYRESIVPCHIVKSLELIEDRAPVDVSDPQMSFSELTYR